MLPVLSKQLICLSSLLSLLCACEYFAVPGVCRCFTARVCSSFLIKLLRVIVGSYIALANSTSDFLEWNFPSNNQAVPMSFLSVNSLLVWWSLDTVYPFSRNTLSIVLIE